MPWVEGPTETDSAGWISLDATINGGYLTVGHAIHHFLVSPAHRLVCKDNKDKVRSRVSVQGVTSLGRHFATLCREFNFYEVKKNYFSKRKGKYFTILIIFVVKSLQKEQNSRNLVLWTQSTGINLQSPQSD